MQENPTLPGVSALVFDEFHERHLEGDVALARARQIEVVERHILPAEIAKADEAFLAGTAAEVTPVRQIGELSFGSGPITQALLADYEALVRMSPEEAAKIAA